MENISCIFCDTSSNPVVIRENGFNGEQCQNCQLIYVTPRPTIGEVMDLYGHDNAHVSAESHLGASYSKKLYAGQNLQLIKKHIAKGKLLELGAGAGSFMLAAQQKGFDCAGIEFNPIQAQHIREKLQLPCEEKGLDELAYTSEYDVIYHCDVVSHFFDPINEFKLANKTLNDNGYLVFETGNIAEMDAKYFDLFDYFQYPDHLFFFTTENIDNLLNQTGFELIKIYKYSLLPQFYFCKFLNLIKGCILTIKKQSNTKKQSNIKKQESQPEKLHIANSEQQSDVKNQTPSSSRVLLRNIIDTVIYIMRYKVGRITPKKNRPQTMIVVARKINTKR